MSTCPACNQEIQRRKRGACPLCGEEIGIWNGLYYRESEGSPPTALLNYFEQLVSKQQSAKTCLPVGFRIPRRSPQYGREIAFSENLLTQYDNDYALLTEALDILFTERQFSFKAHTSLLQTSRDMPLAIAIAKAVRENAEKIENHMDANYGAVMQRENVFDY